MIVCLCHRVSDRDIHRVVGEGVTNFELLQDLTRVASNCGNCLDCAQMIFDEACAARGCGGQHVHAGGAGQATTGPAHTA
ncbi:(2Fe-2S)-binding protein [Ideonella sp. DXS29W]|uniref:Bacterioferritin-associated ferredoxin n=1 Tax=Ideonella lacteola TaxID=2984193 RepID=A0ABU9BJT9_9BURK